jgi:diguanylate cyclase (GGDEF)-like protein
LKLTDALPARIRGRSHAATVYVALVAASVLFVVYGLLSAFTSDGDNWRNGISAVLLIAGLPCLVMARAIAIGRISTTLSIDRAALTGLLLLAATNYQQLAVHPAAAESLTAQSCLMVVMAGLVLRSNVMQGLAWLGFLLPWLIVVALARPPHFSLGAWLSTWMIAFMLSAAASLITATERDVARGVLGSVRTAASTDALTGLVNRSGFGEQGPRVLALARRHHSGVWCGFVDVDGFKAVNDELGHDTGDQVLIAVAGAIGRVARESDLPARWGGDEFVILGHGLEPDPVDLETRLRARLERLPREILDHWPATVTVGIAGVVDANETDLAGLIAAADAAMYQRRRDLGRSLR